MDNLKFKLLDNVLITNDDGIEIEGMIIDVIPWAYASFLTREEYPNTKVFYRVDTDDEGRWLLPDHLVRPYVSVAKN